MSFIWEEDYASLGNESEKWGARWVEKDAVNYAFYVRFWVAFLGGGHAPSWRIRGRRDNMQQRTWRSLSI